MRPDLPSMDFATGSTALPRIGRRELRERLGPILSQVRKAHGAIEVLNHGRSDVVVVDYHFFEELRTAHRDAAALRESTSLLFAAAMAGVAIPSETLDRLGLGLPHDPDALKHFRTHYPVVFTHDEVGNQLADVPELSAQYFDDSDEDELVLVDVDD